MIRKLLILSSVSLLTSYSYGMDSEELWNSDSSELADPSMLVDRILTNAVDEIKSRDYISIEAEVLAADILDQNLLIMGPDVSTPLSELEKISPEEFRRLQIEKLRKKGSLTKFDFEGAFVVRGTPVEKKLKRVIYVDSSRNGLEQLYLGTYLSQVSETPEKLKSCLDRVCDLHKHQMAFIYYHMMKASFEYTCAHKNKRDVDSDVSDKSLEMHMHATRAVCVFNNNIIQDLARHVLYKQFKLPITNEALDYEAQIQRTKQMLEEFLRNEE